MKKRFLSIMMALCLALSLLPATALAAEDTGVECEQGDSCTTHTAAIGSVHYTSLADAISAAGELETVKLLKDVELTSRIVVSNTATLDLNGKSITRDEGNTTNWLIGVAAAGNLTILDSVGSGKIQSDDFGDNRGYGVLTNGRLVIQSGEFAGYFGILVSGEDAYAEIHGGKISGQSAAVQVQLGGEAAIDGGTLTCKENFGVTAIGEYTPDAQNVPATRVTVGGTAKISGSVGAFVAGKGAELTVNNGEISGDAFAISGNGTKSATSDQGNTVINIYGGKITSTNAAGIYHPQDGVLTVTGGEITGTSGIEIRSGTLNISGDAEITATAEEFVIDDNGSGSTTDGAAIAVAQHTTKQPITVNITGGTFTGVVALNDSNIQNNDGSSPVTIEIENGQLNGALQSDGFADITVKDSEISGNVTNSGTGDLEITGGTITGNVTNSSKGETVISNAEVTGTVSNTGEDSNKGSVAIIDSTVGAVTAGQDIILVNTSVDGGEPTTDVGKNVAMVGANVYLTLKEAIDAANKGDTVRLLNDVTLSASGIGGGNDAQALTIDKDLTIDGQGKYTIKGENFASNVRLITVTDDADVTFNEVTLDGGNVEPDTQGARHGLNLWNAGKVTLNDVTIKNCDWYAVANNGSELIVNGLTTNGNAWGINIDNDGTAVINNANISEDSSIVYENGGGNGSLTVNGGTYQNLVVQAEDEEDVCGGTIELKDGSFKGVTTNGRGETNDTEIVSISGGNYKTDVSKYVDSGLTWDPSTGEVAKPVEPDDDDDRPSQGGGSSSSEPSYSPVMDVSKGGSVKVNPRTPGEGDEVTITVDPDRGYEVGDVTVTDRSGRDVRVTAERDGTYTFEQPKGRVTIAVTFVREGTSTFFADVAETYWAYDEIAWAYENGYVNGVTATTFAPGASISRQQIWMILARLAGDDPADMAAARQWSIDNGISDGTNPGNAVTRQQLAALLFRFAQANGYDSGDRAALTGFPDAGSVASYAVEALQWATASGILNGTTDGTLNPTGTATRAQFAVMLYRFWTGV